MKKTLPLTELEFCGAVRAAGGDIRIGCGVEGLRKTRNCFFHKVTIWVS